jgi:hypothetical protein
MNNSNPSANANAWQSPNSGAPAQTQGVSLPGALPPSIANQPAKGPQQSGPAQQPGKPDNASKSTEQGAPFPELGRAGSVFGWMLDFVSPRSSNAQDASSNAPSASGNLLMIRVRLNLRN